MKYFKNSKNEIFAYEDEDIAKVDEYNQSDEKENFSDFIPVLAEKLKDLTKVTEQEALSIANPPPTDAQLAQQRIAELQFELSKTDFKFSLDYDKKDTPEWLQLKSYRQSWREEIRQLEQSV